MGLKFLILSVACFAFLSQPAHAVDVAYLRSEGTDPVQEISSLVPKLIVAKGNAVMKAAADVASVFATGMGLGVRTFGKASSDIKGAISDGLLAIGDSILRAGDTATGASSRNGRVLVRRPLVQEVVEEVKVRRPALVEEVKMRRPALVEEVKVRRPAMVEEINVVGPNVVKEEYVIPCDEEVVEVPVESIPIRSVKTNVHPAMTIVEPARRVNLVRNEPSLWNLLANAVQAKMNAARMHVHGPARSPTFYEVIKEPRLLPGPWMDTLEFEFKKK